MITFKSSTPALGMQQRIYFYSDLISILVLLYFHSSSSVFTCKIVFPALNSMLSLRSICKLVSRKRAYLKTPNQLVKNFRHFSSENVTINNLRFTDSVDLNNELKNKLTTKIYSNSTTLDFSMVLRSFTHNHPEFIPTTEICYLFTNPNILSPYTVGEILYSYSKFKLDFTTTIQKEITLKLIENFSKLQNISSLHINKSLNCFSSVGIKKAEINSETTHRIFNIIIQALEDEKQFNPRDFTNSFYYLHCIGYMWSDLSEELRNGELMRLFV